MRIVAELTYESTMDVEVEVPDDGFSDGDVLAAASERHPDTDFTAVVGYYEPNAAV